MTRLERLQAQALKDAEKLAKTQDRVVLEEARKLEKARQANDKRRYRIGAIVDEAGLFVLDDLTLGQLFALLAPLATLPDPVHTLDGLIGVPLVLASNGVEVLPEKA
jgi:hypothetical protein